MPCDYKNYPPDWKTEIRPRILARADNKCEWCGVKNGAQGLRDKTGKFYTPVEFSEGAGDFDYENDRQTKTVKIVLTIAHLDHDVKNNADINLAALCQQCHLKHDRKQHTETARKNRDIRSGQLNIFQEVL